MKYKKFFLFVIVSIFLRNIFANQENILQDENSLNTEILLNQNSDLNNESSIQDENQKDKNSNSQNIQSEKDLENSSETIDSNSSDSSSTNLKSNESNSTKANSTNSKTNEINSEDFQTEDSKSSNSNLNDSNSSELNSNDLTRLISLDFGYTLFAIKKNGLGIGLTYEQYIWNHLAAKTTFGHSVFFHEGKFFPTVSLSLYAIYYPFRTWLNGFYFGVGSYLDFAAFPEPVKKAKPANNIYISIVPLIGYKVFITNWLFIDLSVAYKYIFENKESNKNFNYKEYLSNGFLFGSSFKFYFEWRSLNNFELF